MNPLRIQAQNLRTFERLDLDIPSGCCVIGGENGAGKSTILSAIDVALFAGRGELAPLLTLGDDELWLELEFEHAGEAYRVRRTYSAKGRGKTTLDLERSDPEGDPFPWQPLTRETADQTQQYLEQILGLSRATFRASSFLAQGDGAAFTEASPRDRKAILAEILGLDIWDRLLDLARRDLRALEDETLTLRTRAQSLQERVDASEGVTEALATARTALADATDQQVWAEAQLERAREALAANAAAYERFHAAEVARANAGVEQERVRKEYARAVQAGVDRAAKQAELDQAAEITSGIPLLEEELEQAREWSALVEQRDGLRRRIAEKQAEIEDCRAKARELDARAAYLLEHKDDAGDCDRCGQKLGAEAATRAAASYQTDAEVLVLRASQLDGERKSLIDQADAIPVNEGREVRPVGNIESDLRLARAYAERRAALEVEVRDLAERMLLQDDLAIALADVAETVRLTEAALASVREQVKDPAELQLAVTNARREHKATTSALDTRKALVTRLELAEQQAKTAADELATVGAGMAELARRLDILKLAERAFGRDGIPALIVENAAIPQLEMEANRILGELGGATVGCTLELRTQRLLKTTEALRETLDIVIVTPDGERAYETFSGGERTRLNLALRIALARLLAHRRGAESRLLAIDEPDGLDAAGMDALAAILQGLAGDFDKILVVSHQPQLATSFDQTLTVAKDGDRSHVEAGAPLEEVAA